MIGSESIRPESVHFHIHWSTNTLLDWQAFETREEADAIAQELVRENETYTIEQRGSTCTRCVQVLTARA